MSPRLGFVLSLLAACGIHAVVLLVPRTAISEEAPIPTVELDLAAATAREKGPPAVTPAIAPRAAAVRAERATQHAPAEAAALEASRPAAASVEQSAASFPAPSMTGSGASTASEGDGADSVAPAASSAAPAEGAVEAAAYGSPAAASTGLIPPRPRAEILPTYPRTARRSGLEGVVKVAAMVDASGTVTSADVLATSGHASLDQAALEAVRRALFSPALQGGKPVPCRIVIPIRFRLQSP
ncbi:MAG: energy transducer TonB [Spirochaetia bacterium]